MMHLEQHQVHQALQGGNVRPFVEGVLFGRHDKTGSILSLEYDPQGLALFLIQQALLAVKLSAVMLQKSEGLIQMALTQGGTIVTFGADIELAGIDLQG